MLRVDSLCEVAVKVPCCHFQPRIMADIGVMRVFRPDSLMLLLSNAANAARMRGKRVGFYLNLYIPANLQIRHKGPTSKKRKETNNLLCISMLFYA